MPHLSTPSVILIDLLSSLPPEVYLILAVLVLLLLASFLLPSWWGPRGTPASQARQLSGVTLEPRSIMKTQEALLFNALHLIVRDQYLLLAKIPVRHLIQLDAGDNRARQALWYLTKNILADFVLLHPGSLIPEKVIFVSSDDQESPSSNMPVGFVEDLLGRAQIGIVYLSSQQSYSVEELSEILGMGEE